MKDVQKTFVWKICS